MVGLRDIVGNINSASNAPRNTIEPLYNTVILRYLQKTHLILRAKARYVRFVCVYNLINILHLALPRCM